MVNQFLLRIFQLAFLASWSASAVTVTGLEDTPQLYSIEIDGKFTTSYPWGDYVTGIHSKLEVQTDPTRSKRESREPPLNFNGTLTFRSPSEVRVFGVTALFSVDPSYTADAPTPGSRRPKREGPKFSVGWYGQFRFTVRETEHTLGIRANLSITEPNLTISRPYDEPTSPLGEDEDDVSHGFQGTLASIKKGDVETIGVFFNLGIKDKTVPNRFKRDDDETTLKLDGKWTRQHRWRSGVIGEEVVYKVQGEATVDDYTDKQIPRPKEEFISETRNKILLASVGNLTAKVAGEDVFNLPVTTEWLGVVPAETSSDGKRQGREANERETVEVEYKGNFSFDSGDLREAKYPQILYGVTAKLKFWEISKSG